MESKKCNCGMGKGCKYHPEKKRFSDWPTNKDHANKARKLLIGYSEASSSGFADEDIIDILADIRHLCDQKKLDFADLDRQAYQHYAAEVVTKRRKI